jgi:hypothetical protein
MICLNGGGCCSRTPNLHESQKSCTIYGFHTHSHYLTVSLLFFGWIYPDIYLHQYMSFSSDWLWAPMQSWKWTCRKNSMQQMPRQLGSTFYHWKDGDKYHTRNCDYDRNFACISINGAKRRRRKWPEPWFYNGFSNMILSLVNRFYYSVLLH